MKNLDMAAGFALAAIVLSAGAGLEQGSLAQPAQFTPSEETPEQFPAGPGRDDTFYACTACHNFKLVAAQGMTRRQWEDSLQWMTDKHKMAPLPDKEKKIVLDYLEATFPPSAPTPGRGWQNPFAPR
jgi:hypothetical protein